MEVTWLIRSIRSGKRRVYNYIDKEKVKEIAEKYKINLPNAEVVQLSREKKAELVLVNEEEIRRACKDFGFDIKGCLGILLKAVEEKIITSSNALNDIQKLIESGYRIEKSIVRQVKRWLSRK